MSTTDEDGRVQGAVPGPPRPVPGPPPVGVPSSGGEPAPTPATVAATPVVVAQAPADRGTSGPTPVGDGTSTGDDAVDAALTLLDGLDAQPLRAHVTAFEQVHGALQDRLAEAEGDDA